MFYSLGSRCSIHQDHVTLYVYGYHRAMLKRKPVQNGLNCIKNAISITTSADLSIMNEGS